MAIQVEPVDDGKLEQFVFRAVDEVGATLNAALVVMGDRLGLYRGAGRRRRAHPRRARGAHRDDRALRARVAQRPGRRRLRRLSPGRGPPTACRPSRPSRSADEDSPAYLPGLFQNALGSVLDSPQITDAVRTGAGVGWHEHNHDVHDGCERFFRPGYNANLRRVAGCPRSTASSSASSAAPGSPTSAAATAPRRS